MIVNSVGVAVHRRCEGFAAHRDAVLRVILSNLYGSFGGKMPVQGADPAPMKYLVGL